jgi:uncharacterized DUF497 family protein
MMATGPSAKNMGCRSRRSRLCSRAATRIAPDPKHSADEDRLIAVGKTSTGRPLFVAFTMRTTNGRRLIRPVTARYMHAREIAAYEKAAYEKESATPKNR